MDCNCVSDLLLPPVPALWTPGQSHHRAASSSPEVTYFVKIKILTHVQTSSNISLNLGPGHVCNHTAKQANSAVIKHNHRPQKITVMHVKIHLKLSKRNEPYTPHIGKQIQYLVVIGCVSNVFTRLVTARFALG